MDTGCGVTLYVAAVSERSRRHEIAHALCREALAELCGVAAEGIVLAAEPSGKPYAPDLDAQFSLSHSGGLAMCAVGRTPVGVDIERAREVSPRLRLRAQRAGYDGAQEFLYWWTAREANGKRLGVGFTWSDLPAPNRCVQGTLEHEGERYYYSVCL